MGRKCEVIVYKWSDRGTPLYRYPPFYDALWHVLLQNLASPHLGNKLKGSSNFLEFHISRVLQFFVFAWRASCWLVRFYREQTAVMQCSRLACSPSTPLHLARVEQRLPPIVEGEWHEYLPMLHYSVNAGPPRKLCVSRTNALRSRPLK